MLVLGLWLWFCVSEGMGEAFVVMRSVKTTLTVYIRFRVRVVLLLELRLVFSVKF